MIYDLDHTSLRSSIFEVRVLSRMPEPDFIQFPADLPATEEFVYCSKECYLEAADVLKVSEPREIKEWTDPDIMEFSIFLTPEGRKKFYEFTRDYPRERYLETAVIIDGRVIMSPVVWDALDTDEIVVTGRFSIEEIIDLTERLRESTKQ